MLLKTTLLALSAFSQLVFAVPQIVIEGADFVNKNTGNRFQLVGVAYQPGGSSGYTPGTTDPLSDGAACLRDAALMQQLGINTLRVYNLDPTLNHDLCMSIFNSIGVYAVIDVNSPLPGESINRADPASTYTTSYLNRTFAVIEAFKNFPNTLLFFSGNEVINDDASGAINGPYMRAVTRDMKNYIAAHSTRKIPVGYSAADVRDILVDTSNYLQCTTTGDSSDPSRVDTFAVNSYSWCGSATYQSSGYNVLQSYFQNTSVPVFFSEFGCNQVKPRIFTEIAAIYGSDMTTDFSGGLVYEYAQEDNDYGLVKINSNGSANVLADFDTLRTRYAALNFTSIEGVAPRNTTNTPPACSAGLITSSQFSKNWTLPITPAGAATLIKNGLTNVNQGKLVSVTTTAVSQQVFASSGTQMQGLAIRVIADDATNTPSNATTTGAAASSSSKAAAVGERERRSVGALVAGVGVAAIAFL